MKRFWAVCCLFLLVFAFPLRAQALELSAPSALLMEKETGTILYAEGEHEPREPASVTKIMTLLLTMEAIDSGALSYDDAVTGSTHAASMGGSQIWLKEGEQMSVRDLLKAVCIVSGNDAAVALGEHIAGSEDAFVERMNRRAQELGMNDTHFVNCTGLDDDDSAKEHRTSAYDIALMSRELLKNHPDIKKYTTIWMDTVRGGVFGLANTNKMVRFYSGCTGLKTGFTSGAGYCLSASAARDGMELIAVVMGAKTSKDRFAACKSMLDYGFANFAIYTPVLQEGASVPVTLGEADSVAAVPAGQINLLVDKSQRNSIGTELALDETVTAPVSRGQRLGTLTIKAGEQILSQIPLVAESAVSRLTWGQLTLRLLRRIAMAGI